MEITIYTNEGCIWCTRTKELMARADVEYTEIKWNSLSTDEQLKLKDDVGPNLRAFPAVVIDGEFVGGLVDVAKIFLKKGLVSARQG
jgi:glutaredoxin